MTKSPRNQSTKVATILGLATVVAFTLIIYMPTHLRYQKPLYQPRVCAFYYTWYGNATAYYGELPGTENLLLHWGESHPDLDPPIIHDPLSDPWDIASAQHPTLNTSNVTLYDSCDVDAIKYHLDLASGAGIDTFICTWWGPNEPEDYKFRQVLNITERDGYPMEHSVYFESNQGSYNKTNPACVDNLYQHLKFIVEQYGNHSNFLRIDDASTGKERPVIFVYSPTAKASWQNWTDALSLLHGDGLYPFLIGDIGNPEAPSLEETRIFDGIHVYNPLGLYANEPSKALSRFQELVIGSRFSGKLACTTVLPGYNDTQVRHGTAILERENGATYNTTWEVALESNCDWVLICTWNEWHEGSEIEPSYQNGTYYVDATAPFVSAFKS
ncbi:hypothetical protein GF325_02200 [Candidatus Bathyarchaeota archaeon]|nr:hypothetical protein [Candidatus Bathyarchaeota archaeon]